MLAKSMDSKLITWLPCCVGTSLSDIAKRESQRAGDTFFKSSSYKALLAFYGKGSFWSLSHYIKKRQQTHYGINTNVILLQTVLYLQHCSSTYSNHLNNFALTYMTHSIFHHPYDLIMTTQNHSSNYKNERTEYKLTGTDIRLITCVFFNQSLKIFSMSTHSNFFNKN